MNLSPDLSWLTGSVSALVLCLIGVKILWPAFNKANEGRIAALEASLLSQGAELKDCHDQHTEAKLELAGMKAKMELMGALNPAQMVASIVAGIKEHLSN